MKDYILDGAKCILIDNITIEKECKEFYVRDENEKCVIKYQVLSMATKIMPLLNIIRFQGLKSFLLTVNNLNLYNYHKN